MRYYKKQTLIISEDTTDPPKLQKFAVEDAITDLTTIVNEVSNTQTYGISAVAVNLGVISQVRFFYLKADKVVTVELNGGSAITSVVDKPIEFWGVLTSVTVNILSASTRVVTCVAGS